MSGVDIYTGQTIMTPSTEHVIPSSLGGRLKLRGLLDKATNERLGSEIDAALARALLPLRVLVDARADRGNAIAPDLRNVRGDDGALYDVRAGGVVVPAIGPRRLEPHDAKVRIEGVFQGQSDVERWVRRMAKKRDVNAERILAELPSITEDVTIPCPRLSFDHELYTEPCYRAIAKIAFNLLASRKPELARATAFDDFRGFVNDDRAPRPPVEAVRLSILGGGLGPVDHLVAVHVSHDGTIRGLVVFFGALAFVVRLGDVMAQQPASFSYRVNQVELGDVQRGARTDHPDDLAIAVPDYDAAYSRSRKAFTQLVHENLATTAEAVLKVQAELHRQRLLASAWEAARALVPDPEEDESEFASRFARELARRLVEGLGPEIEASFALRRAAEGNELD